MKAVDIFPVSEEEGNEIDHYKEIFPYVQDLRAALEEYFHIYDDFAVMSPEEFDSYFGEYVKDEDETFEEENNIMEEE